MVNYQKLKVSELKSLAKEKGIDNYQKLKKKDLINLLKGSEESSDKVIDINSEEISSGETSSEYISSEETSSNLSEQEDDNLTIQIEIRSYKIQLKLFIIREVNTQTNPGLKKDVIDLIALILTKYKIHLSEIDSKDFIGLFKNIYERPEKKQRDILRDILVYLGIIKKLF